MKLHEIFYGSEIKASSFINATFIDAHIVASEIRNCDFSNANLSSSSTEFLVKLTSRPVKCIWLDPGSTTI